MFSIFGVQAQSTIANPGDSIGFIQNGIGRVQQIGETWLIVCKEPTVEWRYLPIGGDAEQSPEAWQRSDMEIVFSAVLLQPDPRARMVGNPVRLLEWRRLYRAQPDGN